jgi:hypothetical protein
MWHWTPRDQFLDCIGLIDKEECIVKSTIAIGGPEGVGNGPVE